MTVLQCYLQRMNSIQFLALNFYLFFFYFLGGWGVIFIFKKLLGLTVTTLMVNVLPIKVYIH